MATILGIDIGGTGIKGAPVDTRTGSLLADRHRIPTPQPATPDSVTAVVSELAQFFEWKGPSGATFPAVIKDGVARTAANVDKSWIGTDAAERFSDAIGGEVTVVNDADAAGIAEVSFGAGKNQAGVLILVTLGTGIGSAVFYEGVLVPNTELGHLRMGKHVAEHLAADSVREAEGLSWKEWAKRLNDYFAMLEALFAPDLFIVGGGVSKRADKFLPLLQTTAEIVPARLLNEAGIVGAAIAHDLRSPATHTD
jgi:polyphosphate glucokinase